MCAQCIAMQTLRKAYGIKIPQPSLGFMFNVEKGLSKLRRRRRKSLKTAYLLAIFLGPFGGHQFYLNRWFIGFVYILTFGILGIGWIVDLFRIHSLVEDENDNDETHRNKRSLLDAYLIWFPLGIFGFHHFYLRNGTLGILYLVTFGVYGIGWVLDFFFMRSLVHQSNTKDENPTDLEILKTYLIAASPFGIVGGHQYYSGRISWGLAYTLTIGGCGLWWLVDLFRISAIVRRSREWKGGINVKKKYSDDVYLIWLWFGLLGGHHFYLKRYKTGCIYLFTLGFFGFGWLIDLIRIPWFVHDYNLDKRTQKEITFKEAISGLERNEIQRNEPRRRNSESDEDDCDDEKKEKFAIDTAYKSFRAIKPQTLNINKKGLIKKNSTVTEATKITTVAIISTTRDSIDDRNKTTCIAENNREIKSYTNNEKNGVILSPNFLDNSINITKSEEILTLNKNSMRRSKSRPFRICHPNKSDYGMYDQLEITEKVSNALNNHECNERDEDKNLVSNSRSKDRDINHLEYDKNQVFHSSKGNAIDFDANVTSNMRNNKHYINRVKSDVTTDMVANRKRKALTRSNTQIAGLIWSDPLQSNDKSEMKNGSFVEEISTLPRITKIRSIKNSKSRNSKLTSSMTSVSDKSRQFGNYENSKTVLECGVKNSSTIPNIYSPFNLSQPNMEKDDSQNVSEDAKCDNILEDVEEISFESYERKRTSSLKSVKDTGFGVHNIIPKSRSLTRNSVSFSNCQRPLESMDRRNGSLLVINDTDSQISENVKQPHGFRRSSRQSVQRSWIDEEKTRKRKRSFIVQLTRSKSEVETPVLPLDTEQGEVRNMDTVYRK